MTKFFVINKKLDYDRGYLEGLEYSGGRLRLKANSGSAGWFFSRVFDSRDSGTVWHRFTVDAGSRVSSAVPVSGLRVRFYSFESPEFYADDVKTSVDAVVHDRGLSVREKLRLLEPFQRQHFSGARDMLLHDTEGRYLLVVIELIRRETDNSLGDMFLYFPKQTWMRFLPGVYSRDKATEDFTERYLSIFQSVYDDRDREIRTGAGLIHPSAVSRSLLEGLAAWYDLKDLYLWPDDRLRELVLRAPKLLQKRGTASCLREYLGIYLGSEPEIREYPEDPCSLDVLVPEKYIDDSGEYLALERVIGHMKPAGMRVRLLAQMHSRPEGAELRLGVNSRLENKDADGGEV